MLWSSFTFKIRIMKMLRIASLLILVIAASSCKNNKSSDDQRDNEPLVFEERIFNMESSSCKTDSTHCASVTATYPIAAQGKTEVVTAINDTIMKHVRETVNVFSETPEDTPITLEDAAAGFIGEYEKSRAEDPEYTTQWAIETMGKVLYQSPELVSIQIENYSYAGGAHPNSYILLLNFDAKTGKKFDPVERVTDVKKLMTLAEAKFREARELGPNANLTEEGFFWDGSFILPENIAVTGKGLYFMYNPYEVAAYVMGPTEFTITYDELNDIWKK